MANNVLLEFVARLRNYSESDLRLGVRIDRSDIVDSEGIKWIKIWEKNGAFVKSLLKVVLGGRGFKCAVDEEVVVIKRV